MPVPANVPPLHDFTVLHRGVDGSLVAEYAVNAAYFVEEESYTLFKNEAHAVVGAFPTLSVLLISREGAVRASA